MIKAFKLASHIRGGDFRKFIDICFQYSDYISFTSHGTNPFIPNVIIAIKELEPYLFKKFETKNWHCFYTEQIMNVYIYIKTEEVKHIILSIFNDIFLKVNGEYTLCHEDICFFNKDELFLGTVSHESMCTFYPKSDEMLANITGVGLWEEELFNLEAEIIPTRRFLED